MIQTPKRELEPCRETGEFMKVILRAKHASLISPQHILWGAAGICAGDAYLGGAAHICAVEAVGQLPPLHG